MRHGFTFGAWLLLAVVFVHAQCLSACGAGMSPDTSKAPCHDEEHNDGSSPDEQDRPGLCSDEQALELRMQDGLVVDQAVPPTNAIGIPEARIPLPIDGIAFTAPPAHLQIPLRI